MRLDSAIVAYGKLPAAVLRQHAMMMHSLLAEALRNPALHQRGIVCGEIAQVEHKQRYAHLEILPALILMQ